MIVPYLRVFSHISDPAKLFIVVVDHLQGQRDELRPLGVFFSCTQSDRSGGSPVQIAPDLLTTALEPLFPRAYNGCARCPPLVFVLSSPADLDTPLGFSSFGFVIDLVLAIFYLIRRKIQVFANSMLIIKFSLYKLESYQ